MTREMSIRFDCPATGKRFPPGSNQMPQTEVHALFLPSSLSSPTIMSPDAQVGYVLAQQTHTHTHSHPLSRTLLPQTLASLATSLHSVGTLLPSSPLRRAPLADTALPAPVLLLVALLPLL